MNFFLIITALYQLKPASRSLIIESMGAQRLPYVWIITAVTMIVFISFYHRLVERFSRLNIVLGTCLIISGLLVVFRVIAKGHGIIVPIGLYVFVDILSVVLVEQFWSLTNSIYTTQEGKSWYGFVGTGGLVGGESDRGRDPTRTGHGQRALGHLELGENSDRSRFSVAPRRTP